MPRPVIEGGLMRRHRRLAGLVLLALALGGAGWRFAAPAALAGPAAARLTAALGGPVRVAAVRVGLAGTSLRGLALYEADGSPADEPWAVVPEARADLSVRDLLAGRTTPRAVTLDGAVVLLRFDRAGRLLTRLPAGSGGPAGGLPALSVRHGQLTLRQEGHAPDLVLHGVTADLHTDGGRLVLTGTVADPEWGEWAVTGGLDRAGGAGTLRFQTARVAVTPVRLAALPLVPPAVWERVRADGATAADATLRFVPGVPGVGLLLAFTPDGMTVRLPALGLTADAVRGTVEVEADRVRLRGVTAAVAGGRLGADGGIDLGGPQPDLHLALDATDLDLRGLPAGWGLPTRLRGRLDGRADVCVTHMDGHVRVTGTGDGRLRGVPVGGQSATITLALRDEPPPTGPGASGPAAPACCLVAEGAAGDVDVGRMVAEWGVVPPVPVAGRVALRVRLALPLDTLGDPRTARLDATAALPRGVCGGVPVEGVRARLAARGGELRLEELSGVIPGPADAALATRGTFHAAGGVGLAPAGVLHGRLTLTGLPLARLAVPSPLAGTASAAVVVRAPAARLGDLAAWEGAAAVTADRVEVAGHTVVAEEAGLTLRAGILAVTGFRGRADGVAVTGTGDLALAAPWRFRAALDLGAELPALRRLLPSWQNEVAVGGRADTTAALAGTLHPLRVEGSGGGAVTSLVVGAVRVGRLPFRWQADPDRLVLADLAAAVYGGRVTGDAVIPLRAVVSGRLDLRVHDLDLPALAAAVPSLPVRPPGRLSGTLRASAEPTEPGRDRALAATFDLQTPDIRLGGEVGYRGGVVAYRLDGEALGGRVHLDGQAPTPAAAAEGSLRLDGVAVARLAALLGAPAVIAPLAGSADLHLRFRHDTLAWPAAGRGSAGVRRLRWGDHEIAPDLKTAVRLTADGVSLDDMAGAVAGGRLRGQASLPWNDPAAGHLDLSLDGAEASRLLAVWPAVAARVRGPLEARLRVTPGAEWRAAGRVTLHRGAVAGVEVDEWLLPVEAAYTPARGQGRVEVRDSNARVARGRATGRATCRWGSGTQADGEVRFDGVSLRHLLSGPAATERLAGGLLSGRLEVRGVDVKSADDLTAGLDATLRQTPAVDLPVLREVVAALDPAGTEATVFDTGEVRARLARGAVRVERLALVGPTLRLTTDGTLGAGGRVGLDVRVETGRLGVSPDAPVSVRLARLRVDETVARPAVQVVP